VHNLFNTFTEKFVCVLETTPATPCRYDNMMLRVAAQSDAHNDASPVRDSVHTHVTCALRLNTGEQTREKGVARLRRSYARTHACMHVWASRNTHPLHLPTIIGHCKRDGQTRGSSELRASLLY
jgi:hypothetical protein